MCVVTSLILPVQCEDFAVRGLGNVIAKFKEIKRMFNPQLIIRGMLLVMIGTNAKITKAYIQQLRDTFTDAVFNSTIRRNIRASEAQSFTGDVFDYDATCNAAKDYNAFIEEFLATSPIKS